MRPGRYRHRLHMVLCQAGTATRLSEAAVLSLAQQEGIKLFEAPGTATGYKGVTKQTTAGSCYMARASGKHLGSFPSAHEAALMYARHISSTSSAVAANDAAQRTIPAPMCESQSEALHLLETKANSTGYRGVSFLDKGPKPFKASIPSLLRENSDGYLGCFRTAEEAALAIVRRVGVERVREVVQRSMQERCCYEPLDAETERTLTERAEADAQAEGLTLITSQKCSSGYKCVIKRTLKRKHDSDQHYFLAYENVLDHTQRILGSCRTAAEAALIVARHRAKSAAPADEHASNIALDVGPQLLLTCSDTGSQEL